MLFQNSFSFKTGLKNGELILKPFWLVLKYNLYLFDDSIFIMTLPPVAVYQWPFIASVLTYFKCAATITFIQDNTERTLFMGSNTNFFLLHQLSICPYGAL